MKFTIYTIILILFKINSYCFIIDTIIASEENNETFLWYGKENYEKIEIISNRIQTKQKSYNGPIRIIITNKVHFKNYLSLLKSLKKSIDIQIYYIDDFKNYNEAEIKGYYLFDYKGFIVPLPPEEQDSFKIKSEKTSKPEK